MPWLALKGGSGQDTIVAYVVLAVAGIAEGISFIRAYSQLRGQASSRRTGLLDHVRRSPDTTVKAALVAFRLGLDSRDLLIGRAADPRQQEVIRAEIEGTPGVAAGSPAG